MARYQHDKVNTPMALRNAIGVAVPLALGLATGAIASSAAVATGALNVSFSDGSDPYLQRAYRMMASSVLVGVAVCAGALAGHDPVTATAIATIWAFAAGMLVALSNAAPDIGLVSLVTLVVFAYRPLPLESALFSGLLAFSGGLLQSFLALALWPVRPYRPERRGLAALYSELSRVAAMPAPEVTQAPPASAQSNQAHDALASLMRDRSVQAERFHLLLSEAERLRLSLLTLARLEVRIRRESKDSPAVAAMSRFFQTSSRILRVIGEGVVSSESVDPVPELVEELRGLTDAVRMEYDAGPGRVPAMLRDARVQMDAVAGQLRAALDLASHASRAGEAEFDRREYRQPWRLRLSGALATLRANLHAQSPAFRHGLRLAVVVGCGEAFCRFTGIQRGYWTPMTIALVLKPDFGSTFSRGVLRLGGTFAGLAAASALVHMIPSAAPWEVLLVGVWMFVVRAYGPANYGILSAAVAGLVVSLIAVMGISPFAVILPRAMNTALGGLIALFAYALWPTRERTQVREALAQMLDAYREYFRAVRLAYENPDRPSALELEKRRVAGRLARSRAEASAERLAAEPGTTEDTNEAVTAILAASHRLIHAVMSLEGGLVDAPPVKDREAFTRFANHLELTLYYLASVLRGARLTLDALPDLREDQHGLLISGDPRVQRYALVNVETDRITNSVNTLSAALFHWLEAGTPRREAQPVN